MSRSSPLVATHVATGDTERLHRADELAARIARRLDLPEPRRERVSMNAVYVAGPCAIRVCRPTTDPVVAIHAAHFLAERDIAVARPYVSRSFVDVDLDPDLWGTTWHLVDIDHDAEPDWTEVGRMVRTLHDVPLDDVAAMHPLPLAGQFPWWNLETTIDELSAEQPREVTHVLVDAHERLRWVTSHLTSPHPDHVVVHGDLHPGNVVVERRTGRTIILDWDLLASSPRGWDHGPLLRWTERWGGRPGTYEDFAAGYGENLSADPVTRGIAELRLLVATVMRLRASITDATARDEAVKRIGFWSGNDTRSWNAV